MAGLSLQHPWAFAFGLLGNVISFMTFLAPIPTFYRIYKSKSTEGFQSVPYVVALFSAMLWIFYALIKSNETFLITINAAGCVIETIYVVMYFVYAPKKAKMFTAKIMLLLNVGVFGVILLLTLLLFKGDKRVVMLGWICVGFSVSVFVAPLSIMPAGLDRAASTRQPAQEPTYLKRVFAADKRSPTAPLQPVMSDSSPAAMHPRAPPPPPQATQPPLSQPPRAARLPPRPSPRAARPPPWPSPRATPPLPPSSPSAAALRPGAQVFVGPFAGDEHPQGQYAAVVPHLHPEHSGGSDVPPEFPLPRSREAQQTRGGAQQQTTTTVVLTGIASTSGSPADATESTPDATESAGWLVTP